VIGLIDLTGLLTSSDNVTEQQTRQARHLIVEIQTVQRINDFLCLIWSGGHRLFRRSPISKYRPIGSTRAQRILGHRPMYA
jgi:hypothetical protein